MKYATFDTDGMLNERLIEGVHEIPANAVAVSEALWRRMVVEQDGLWSLDETGEIVKRPLPEPTPDYVRTERFWRDTELHANEWMVTRHRDELDLNRSTSLLDVQYIELLTYRQALRDWPSDDAFPGSDHRPAQPEWMMGEQT